jgi:CubicO group peptidase (beta-lactamase class C family)
MAWGYSHYDKKSPVDENIHFRAGSIAKSFVALGILKLVEEGKIKLRDPVHEIIPELDIGNPWRETDPVLIVHLLEHTAGFNDTHFNDFYLDGDPAIPLLDGLKVSKNCLKVRWRPGAWRSYSSVGYGIAGCVIERITGEKFEDYLERIVLRSFNMSTSTFRLTSESRRLLAQGYESNYKPVPYWYSYMRPAGEFNTSAREMALFLQGMLNRGKVGEKYVLSKESIDRMESSVTDPAIIAGLREGAGLGIGIDYYRGFRFYSHLGSTAGFAGAYTYSRDVDRGCVLLTNRYDANFVEGISAVWDAMRSFVIRDAMPQRDQVSPPFTIPVEKLEEYAGWYQLRNPQQQISAWLDMITNYMEIRLEGDTLFLGDPLFGGNWVPLIPVTSSTFRLPDEHIASKAFFVTRDNTMAFIRGRSGYEKTPSWKPWFDRILFIFSWMAMLSTIFYAIVWIPIELYKRFSKKKVQSQYLRIRIVPLLAIVIFIVSLVIVATQSLMEYGQKTPENIFFFIATWIFAVLSFCSLFFAITSFKMPVAKGDRIYAVIVSICFVGMTLYLGYWGIIGIELWAY